MQNDFADIYQNREIRNGLDGNSQKSLTPQTLNRGQNKFIVFEPNYPQPDYFLSDLSNLKVKY